NYEAGIRASFDNWGLGDAADAYLAHAKVAFDGSKAVELITEQKWMAIFGQGVEAFAEVRRTHTPSRIFEYELEGTEYPGLGLPIRMPYSDGEQSENGLNLNDAKSRQSIPNLNDGMFGARVWWDVRENPIPTEKDPQDG
ncbi:MAG: SusD/RagB family nutrient-binding outer membrane lipoprotein, partial [Bacteroidetes bacterium]|nr:SusD/RagB family nutrient-binding outer membrane lipoprotein [Bacteroidota bacterium]